MDDDNKDFKYIGFWWRVLAYFIDCIFLSIINYALSLVIGFIVGAHVLNSQTDVFDKHTIISQALNILPYWMYFALMESSSIQATLGKMAIGAKVVDINGNRIGFLRATGRYFSKLLSGILLCVGYLMVAFTSKKQGLHDKIAGTFVLKG